MVAVYLFRKATKFKILHALPIVGVIYMMAAFGVRPTSYKWSTTVIGKQKLMNDIVDPPDERTCDAKQLCFRCVRSDNGT